MANPTPQDPNRRPVRPQPLRPQPMKPQSVKPQPVKPQPLRPQSPTQPQSQPLRPQSPAQPQSQPLRPQSLKPQSLKPQPVSANTPLTGVRPILAPAASEPVELSDEALAFASDLYSSDTDFLDEKDAYLSAEINVRESVEEEEEITDKIVKGAPPWFISTIGHVILMLLFALIFSVVPPKQKPIMIECSMVPEEEEIEEIEEIEEVELGVQQEIETETYVETEQPEAAEMAEEDKPVDDPMLEPEAAPVTEDGNLAAALKEAPVGARFDGRTPGGRKGLLGKYGGTVLTEDAVELGLQWLVRQQEKKGPNAGSWSLSGPYADGLEDTDNRIAATAMALLAFHGAGYTHYSARDLKKSTDPKMAKEYAKILKNHKRYQKTIATAWKWLLKQQGPEGQFFPQDAMHNHKFYTHAQASIALCEIYALTKNDRYREPAKKAIKVLLDTQHDDGAWRYTTQKDEMSDLSVTGWALMALQSAKMAGLDVPQSAFDGITRYLDSNGKTNDQTFYRYTVQEVYPSLSMTVEAMLCRQYLGWKQDDPRMEKALDRALKNPIGFKGETDVYCWYYATQAMHHKEGRWWTQWNMIMREELPANQVKKGTERGSWDPGSDRFAADQGGRLFMTCLNIYMLEVYYRHLPIYAKIFDADGKMNFEPEPETPEGTAKPAASETVEPSGDSESDGEEVSEPDSDSDLKAGSDEESAVENGEEDFSKPGEGFDADFDSDDF